MVTTVTELMRTAIRDCRPLATVRDAAVELHEEQVGALIVRDVRGVMGVVTEVDLVRALAEGADPDHDRVREVMSDAVVTVAEGASLLEAAERMAEHHIRHLLVIDADRQPVGVISARDLLAVLGTPTPLEAVQARTGGVTG